MSDLTGYLEGQIAEWIASGNDMPTAPGTLYVALHTADEGNNPDGSNEVAAGDYGRASATSSDFTILSGDGPTTLENANEISFGDPTNDWGTITHVGLWDGSSSSDNPIAFYSLNSSKQVLADIDKVSFKAGELDFSLN